MSITSYNIVIAVTSYDDSVGPIFTFMINEKNYTITLRVGDGTYVVQDSKKAEVSLFEACDGSPLVFYYVLSEIYGAAYDAVLDLEERLVEEEGFDVPVVEDNKQYILDDQVPTDKSQIN